MFNIIATFFEKFKHSNFKRANSVSIHLILAGRELSLLRRKIFPRLKQGHTIFMLPCLLILLVISAFLVNISAM